MKKMILFLLAFLCLGVTIQAQYMRNEEPSLFEAPLREVYLSSPGDIDLHVSSPDTIRPTTDDSVFINQTVLELARTSAFKDFHIMEDGLPHPPSRLNIDSFVQFWANKLNIVEFEFEEDATTISLWQKDKTQIAILQFDEEDRLLVLRHLIYIQNNKNTCVCDDEVVGKRIVIDYIATQEIIDLQMPLHLCIFEGFCSCKDGPSLKKIKVVPIHTRRP